MSMSEQVNIPSDLQDVRAQFERWRRERTGKDRIPETLWEAAVRVSSAHSLHHVSRALRLNHSDLKKRVSDHKAVRVETRVLPVRFVEVPRTALSVDKLPAPLPGENPRVSALAEAKVLAEKPEPQGTVVKVRTKEGARLVVCLPAGERLDVVSLLEGFWRGGE